MSYPLLWWRTPFFYPIGNTPPVCLTRDLAPEENAQVLLLGCGDPRNILYTAHADLCDGHRSLDFTCCDLETSVLARNMVLLTMIGDGISWRYIWRIFYHFYLDSDALQAFISQCRTLIQSSADLTTWNASTYGKYLRFCTEQSMIELRAHLELYVSLDLLPEPQKRALRKSFTSSMKEVLKKADQFNMRVVRATGPLISPTAHNADNDLFQSFWSTGVMKGRSYPNPPASHINPMFAYSLGGREFNVHYSTQPVTAFHLAPAALAWSHEVPRSGSRTIAEDFVDAAMNQFSDWCNSFYVQVHKAYPSITIRLFSGDCILFCHALRKFVTTKVTKTGVYSRPWGLSQVDFTTDYSELESSPAPGVFNIIDTSNVADHLGLLNILLVTVPLLRRKPWSILHTNTLHGNRTLSDKLFVDIPTLSLFLGVTPTSRLSNFTAHSPMDVSSQFISWKYPSSVIAAKITPYPELDEDTPVLVFDELQLGNFFYSVYAQMFIEEDVRGHYANPTLASLERQNTIRFIRASFVDFLSFVHRRVCVDWMKAFGCFMRLADLDSKPLFFGHRLSFQDMLCQLYLANLPSANSLRWSFLRGVRSPEDPFQRWDNVPPIVSVTLKVPRERLKNLEDTSRKEMGIPVLFCTTALLHGNNMNMHSSIRATFGDITVAGDHQNARIVIREDQAGWQGTSPLVISFDTPSWVFTKVGNMLKVSLNVRSTPQNERTLTERLGNPELCIFSTLVTNNKHAWITRYRPNESQEICRRDSDDWSLILMNTSVNRERKVTVGFNARAIANSITLRHTIEDHGIAETLARGVPVSSKTVADTAILVSFEGFEQLFRYPFPIDGDKITTRVARKSSYIEVVAPIRRTSIGLSRSSFPISRTKTSFNLLNIHYINLSKMPTLDPSTLTGKLTWLSNHLGLTFSDQEQESRATGENQSRVAADLKKSISAIFLGLEKRSTTTFGLSNPTTGVYAFIFVNTLRLDLASSQTAVADACVIPLTEKNAPKVMATLREHEFTTIPTLDGEMEAWKALLPTFAERCRTWQHGDRCEYQKRGIPACDQGSSDVRASPLCQCGLGKDLGTFALRAAWKEIQSEATRVAIAPLFPFSFLQSPLEDVDKDTEILGRAETKVGIVAGCRCCGGPGKPALLVCGRCKKTKYCSQKCQKAHWGTHKPECKVIIGDINLTTERV